MGYSKILILWQYSATLIIFLPKAVKRDIRLVRFLKKNLNFTKKTLHVVKFNPKSMISSKGNGSEKQNLQYTLIN